MKEPTKPSSLSSSSSRDCILMELSKYHPVIIEGMGSRDPRDPDIVAQHILHELEHYWSSSSTNNKPKLIITQGDPPSERGISAITSRIAQKLGVSRALISLDTEICQNHYINSDKENILFELQYSDLTNALVSLSPKEQNSNYKNTSIICMIEQSIDRSIDERNQQRRKNDYAPLPSYIRKYALLQEVTKAACFRICQGDITIVHTTKIISDDSVTSFYKVGLELGLFRIHQIVSYPIDDM